MNKLFDLSESDMASEFGEPLPEGSLNTTEDQNISGLGIDDNEETDEENSRMLEELLNSINSTENTDLAREMEEEAKEREAYMKAEEERIAEIERRYNEARYEKEQAEKEERLKQQAEEEAREEAELQAQKEATFVGKLSKFARGFKKKEKPAKVEPETIEIEKIEEPEVTEPEITEPEVIETEPKVEVAVSVEKPVEDEFVLEVGEGDDGELEMPEALDEDSLYDESFTEEEDDFDSYLSVDDEEDKPLVFEEDDELEGLLVGEEVSLGEEVALEEPKVVATEEVEAKEVEVKETVTSPKDSETKEVKPAEVKAETEVKAEPVKAETETKAEKKKLFGGINLSEKFDKIKSGVLDKANEIKATATEKVKEEKPAKPVKAKPVKANTSEKKSDEIDWKYIAQHDELTGLLNTRGYKEALETLPLTAGIIFFDVNNLKYVNDNYSHSAGDRLLTEISKVIMENFGEDNSFRIGGDEFIAIVKKPGKKGSDKISQVIGEIHGTLSTLTKKDKEHIPYSVSAGYAIGDGKHSVEDLVKAADTAMYRNKKAYKDSHPQFNAETPKKQEKAVTPAKEIDHDQLLTNDQRELKERIATNHRVVSNMSTNQVVREIQKKASEIRAVFIASPTFDHLFIIRDVNDFINIVLEQNAVIDYSYLYVVYEGGPCYYGAQEYYTEVTHIFEDITEGLLSGKFKSVKDIQSIKGINIFRNVYV